MDADPVTPLEHVRRFLWRIRAGETVHDDEVERAIEWLDLAISQMVVTK